MTGRDLISAQLRLIGAIASGESISANEAMDGLASTNRMISGWNNDNLLIFTITQETPLALTPGDGSYTLGLGGDLANRPQEIVKALVRDGTTDYPVEIINLDQFTAIPDKSVQSTFPTKLYDDGGYPQRTITLWPVPSAAKSLVLFTKRVLTSIASLDTELSFPDGYEEALIYNGAVRLAPEYGKVIQPQVGVIAVESKASIKRKNHRPLYLKCDPAIVKRQHFNIITGDFR